MPQQFHAQPPVHYQNSAHHVHQQHHNHQHQQPPQQAFYGGQQQVHHQKYMNDVFAMQDAVRHDRIRRLRSLAAENVVYSERYEDDAFEYRHVIIPKAMLNCGVPDHRFLSEEEWHAIGVTQSPGWVQFISHAPEPHVIIFRRQLSDERLAKKRGEAVTLEAKRARALELVRARRAAASSLRRHDEACGPAVPAFAGKAPAPGVPEHPQPQLMCAF